MGSCSIQQCDRDTALVVHGGVYCFAHSEQAHEIVNKAIKRHSSEPAIAEEEARRQLIIWKKGWRVDGWRHQKAKGRNYDPPFTVTSGTMRGMVHNIEHPYRLLGPQPENREIFVSEPYGVSNALLLSLGELMDGGWNVHISAEAALHYPGHTVAIWMEWGDADGRRYFGNLDSL